MAGYLSLAQTARTARARIATARELEARWKTLDPEEQKAARVEFDALKAAVKAVRYRMESGPRGFVREFGAAYKGEEAAAVEEPKSLAALASDLHRSTTALRNKLDAAEAGRTTG